MAFGGNSFLKVVLFIVATIIAWVFLTWMIFKIFEATHVTLALYTDWIILILCFVVALLLGFFAVKLEKLAICLLGAAGGVAIGFMIITATLLHNTAAYWIILVACGVAGALLTLWI